MGNSECNGEQVLSWAVKSVQAESLGDDIKVALAIVGGTEDETHLGEGTASSFPMALLKAMEGILGMQPQERADLQNVHLRNAFMEGLCFCVVVDGPDHPVAHYGMCPDRTESGMAKGCLRAVQHALRNPGTSSWQSVL